MIKVEAWDIMNNRGYVSYNISFYDNNTIYNVYNFPNPFTDKTFFTFRYNKSEPLTVDISVHSLNGKTIYNNSIFLEYNNQYFYKFGWDGIDNEGNSIPKGIYLYHLEIFRNNISIHKDIYKLAKIK